MSTIIETASLRLEQYVSTDENDLTGLLLAALLKFAPTAEGRTNVALEIANCLEDSGLYNLGRRYMTGLIMPSKPSVQKWASYTSIAIY